MAIKFCLEHDFPEIQLELFKGHLNAPKFNEMLADILSFPSRDLLENPEKG